MQAVGNETDDQGSEWFEVKKKHRGSSKHAAQTNIGNWGGISGKRGHCAQEQKSCKKFELSEQKCIPDLPSRDSNGLVKDYGDITNATSNLSKIETLCSGFQNSVGKARTVDTVSAKSTCPSSSITCDVTDAEICKPKGNNVKLPKIKWGMLDDKDLAQCSDSSHINIQCCKNRSEDCSSNYLESSEIALEDTSLTVSVTPSDVKYLINEENLSHDSDSGNVISYKLQDFSPSEGTLTSYAISGSSEGTMNCSIPVASSESRHNALTEDRLKGGPYLATSSINTVVATELKVASDNLGEVVASLVEKNSTITPDEEGANDVSDEVVSFCDVKSAEVEKLGKPIVHELMKIKDVSLNKNSQDKHLKRQKSNNDADECVTDESKERFRERLWCFLFENLNRAVDELYLLCELECDIEQMEEAILVLQEAVSDFRDLASRVQDFEHVKKLASKSNDGSSVTLKSDHRRPHALSWEVRRMTTSAHKAEILSSSLEAFKKIQLERSRKVAVDTSNLEIDLLEDHGLLPNSPKNPENFDDHGDKRETKRLFAQSDTICEMVDSSFEKKMELGSNQKVHCVQVGQKHQYHTFRGSNSINILSGNVGKEKTVLERAGESNLKSSDQFKKNIHVVEKERDKKVSASWKSMNAWKEKRNWEDILTSPFRVSSRVSYSPGMNRRSADRVRVLHDKLKSPEKKKKNAVDLKKEAESKHARAMRIRSELEMERVQKLQRVTEKLTRVTEWQAVRTMKLREGMHARHQRSESRHEAFIAQVVKRAGDESSKVSEVRFITSLNEENKKIILRQKLQDSELRRAEKLQIIKVKQKEDMAREEAVLERKKMIEAGKLQRLADTQRKKDEAQVRREEERKASSAAREARAMEQQRRREERFKAQQEEAELMAQKLAERLYESEQRRKYYLEQIRERASMDFRDQSSPLYRRSGNRDGQIRSASTKSGDEQQENGTATQFPGNVSLQHPVKRRIKKIRQKLMSQKYEFPESSVGSEASGIGYRTAVGTARVKIGRWLLELQRLRQARKEGAASIGLVIADIIKFLDGKEAELQAARQAGLVDFIASALPASHSSRPEDSRVTIHFLKLLRVVLSAHTNVSYFIAQNLLPPIVPLLASALENFIKIAASLYIPVGSILPTKPSDDNFDIIAEVYEGFLLTVDTIMDHSSSDDRVHNMQEGLLELLIAYQVVHRLRDLFALYDRPQVEGSPFPNSILLSIHFLGVLTSKPMTIRSIDWKLSLHETMTGLDFFNNKGVDSSKTSADQSLTEALLNKSNGILADSFTNRASDESCLRTGESVSTSICATTPYQLNDNLDSAKRSNMTMRIVVENGMRHLIYESEKLKDCNKVSTKQSVLSLLSAMSETDLVCLPSLLTAVLLQANNRTSSELGSYVLPSNFEEVATGVLKVLNNLSLLDIIFVQKMLARPDLKTEFFHVMSFLLSHCSSKWKAAGDQVGLLLLESLSLLSFFSLFHPENQAVLRWGKSSTILHKVCDLPFVFFSDSTLMPVLANTLISACFGSGQNKGLVLQELSMDMLRSLLKSCKNVHPVSPTADILAAVDAGDDLKKSPPEALLRRHNGRSSA